MDSQLKENLDIGTKKELTMVRGMLKMLRQLGMSEGPVDSNKPATMTRQIGEYFRYISASLTILFAT